MKRLLSRYWLSLRILIWQSKMKKIKRQTEILDRRLEILKLKEKLLK
jgi:hypothetical protein